nr:hypothetical protein [Leptospira borgpetersenii]
MILRALSRDKSLYKTSVTRTITRTKSPSQNLKKNISQRSGKFLKNVRVPTETVVLKVFSRRLRL